MEYKRINQLINDSGMSKADFYKKVGMTRSGFILMVKNNSIKISLLEKIAEALNVPVSYFFGPGYGQAPQPTESEIYWKGRYDELIKGIKAGETAGINQLNYNPIRALRESVLRSEKGMSTEEITRIFETHHCNSLVFYMTRSGNAYIRTLYLMEDGHCLFFNWKALGRTLKNRKFNPALVINKLQYTYRVSLSDIIFVLEEKKLKEMIKDHYHLDEVDIDLPVETPG
ncbi:MAG TPA: helix-turn-helix transcriptional regulator [Chitinophagaceae bacterium]|nr:helix-turn-helix transcriptional regulator [Chitinophagaceae bacterium]